MTVDVVEQAVRRLAASRISVEAGKKIMYETAVIMRCAKEDLSSSIGVVTVELFVQVCSAGFGVFTSRDLCREETLRWRLRRYVRLRSEIIIDCSVKSHVIRDLDRWRLCRDVRG